MADKTKPEIKPKDKLESKKDSKIKVKKRGPASTPSEVFPPYPAKRGETTETQESTLQRRTWTFNSLIGINTGSGVTSDNQDKKGLSYNLNQEVEYVLNPRWTVGGALSLDALPSSSLTSLLLWENRIGIAWTTPIKHSRLGFQLWGYFHFDTSLGASSSLAYQGLTYFSLAPKLSYQWNPRVESSLKVLYASLDSGFSLISATNGKVEVKVDTTLNSKWVAGIDYRTIFLSGSGLKFNWVEVGLFGGLQW